MPEQPALEVSREAAWFPVARLLRPQGRRGEILAEPLTDLPEVFTEGKQFLLSSTEVPGEAATAVVLEQSWRPQGRNAGRLVVKLAGTDSISGAEALENRFLCLREIDLPALEADAYLVRDLVGCELYDGEQLVGRVVDLQFPVGADGRRLHDVADLLVVERASAGAEDEPSLVPFVKAWQPVVDLKARRITLQLPPGLME